jgi:hypothetical protein
LIFGALYLPTAMGIAHGQDGVFMLWVMIGAYHFAQRQRPFSSGALLALGLIKFHLLLLAPVALAVTRRWRMLQGFCATGAAAVLISVLLGGVGGAYRYVDLLLSKDIERLSPSPELMINLYSVPTNLGGDHVLLPAALSAAVIVLMALAVRDAPLWRFFAGWTVASLLLAPHVFGYDAALLLLPLWLAIFCSKSSLVRFSATFLTTPIPFAGSLMGSPWAMIPSLSLLLLLASLAIEGHRGKSRRAACEASYKPPGPCDC